MGRLTARLLCALLEHDPVPVQADTYRHLSWVGTVRVRAADGRGIRCTRCGVRWPV